MSHKVHDFWFQKSDGEMIFNKNFTLKMEFCLDCVSFMIIFAFWINSEVELTSFKHHTPVFARDFIQDSYRVEL